MGWATRAVERVFGKTIAYTHPDATTYTFDADFQEAARVSNLGAMIEADTVMPALDVRKTALDAIGLWPVSGARVTFTVHDEPRTYRVVVVSQPGPDSVLLVLGERS
jgi:hypothetical protein